MNDIVELFALGIKYVPSTHIANLAFVTKAVIGSCYGKCSHDLLKKSFELLAQIYILNPEVMESYFTDPQDQAIAAIRHIAERGGLQGTEVQDGTQGFEGMQSGYTPSPQRQMSPSGERNIRNEIVEVPQISPDDTGYDDQEDLPQDAHNGDPTSMSLRGQLESFINTFL